MKIYSFIIAITVAFSAAAQKQNFDIVSFTPPKGWTAEKKQDVIKYSIVNNKKKAWCQLAIYGSVVSKGNIEDDFTTLWGELIERPFKATGLKTNDTVHAGDWVMKAGGGKFRFNNSDVTAILTTITGHGVCVGIVTNTNSNDYDETIQSVLESIELLKPTTETGDIKQNSNDPSPAQTGAYHFTSTDFDDGWTSVVKEDWVEVSKPGIKILIHYPNAVADKYNSNKMDGDNNAWNVLVAPRYDNISNFLERGIQDYQSVSFLTADATDKQTGNKVHIVLYKKHYDKGNGKYLEVVADSKAIFEKEFGNNYINRSSWDYLEQTKSWDKLANMQWRNKFAVAANDLIGKWSASDYASLSYYYVSTGGFAGATATSISDEFTFLNDNKYESDHAGASGVVGNQKFSRQVYKGSSTVADWNITLTNRFQDVTEIYDCYFEAVKGGRILQLTDRRGTTISLVKSK